ncbi:hypothetical protein ACJJTC_016442 [Scirpophaga incertulas]
MSVTILDTVKNFVNFISDPSLAVVHFSANWADQCGQVDSVPTVILFKNGTQIDRVDGADAAQITSKVKSYSLYKGTTVTSMQKLEERLKALINKHKIMVFMKGTRDAPRCGFSRTLIQILNATGVQYDTFDILTDEEVRQGLKEYSDWPTYPQLYVKGELIGGLDIIKELQANGELDATINAN